MKKTVYFIEAQYEQEGEWYIEHSYDFSFFHEYQKAKDFMENYFEHSKLKGLRIASYTRKEN